MLTWLGTAQLVVGAAMVAYGTSKIDEFAPEPWVFPHNAIGVAGLLIAATSPVTMLARGFQ